MPRPFAPASDSRVARGPFGEPLISLLAATLAVVVLTAALLPFDAPAAPVDPSKIPANEASHHVGEVAEVCGHVASAAYMGGVRGGPTFLNFDRPYPDQTFTVVIWSSARSRFETPPERFYDGRTICVTGLIETYRGRPQIEVTDPDQIIVTTPLAGGGDLSDTERVLVKSLLSFLGYDTDFGTGEWDERTIEAMIAFQERNGLPTTGEPDAVTLRALARAVLDLTDEEKSLAIRLLLFELVRRQE